MMAAKNSKPKLQCISVSGIVGCPLKFEIGTIGLHESLGTAYVTMYDLEDGGSDIEIRGHIHFKPSQRATSLDLLKMAVQTMLASRMSDIQATIDSLADSEVISAYALKCEDGYYTGRTAPGWIEPVDQAFKYATRYAAEQKAEIFNVGREMHGMTWAVVTVP